MGYLAVVAAAVAVALIVIPLMARAAPSVGLMDMPDPRKVHARAVPRVGGLGIVPATLAPAVLLLPWTDFLASYLFAVSILLLFGLWDDMRQIGHYQKFIGQILAALIVTTYGGLYVESLPVLDVILTPELGVAFTIVAFVGIMNAINHSDGLDGLASGEVLFTLGAVALLAYGAGHEETLILALAAMGAILGFLRYNTHPARVFMGDAGSQFLGFTLGVVLLLLTQRADEQLSAATVLLLVGLPVADIIVVLIKRMRGRMNWFRATRNHVHHRLLNLGLAHGTSVLFIYSFQMLLVAFGVIGRYWPDELLIIGYLLLCSALFLGLALAENRSWRLLEVRKDRLVADGRGARALVVWPRRILTVAIPGYLLMTALSASNIPRDCGVLAAFLALGVLVLSSGERSGGGYFIRIVSYGVVGLLVYLGEDVGRFSAALQAGFLGVVALLVALTVRYSPGRRKDEFHWNTTDGLVAMVIGMLVLGTGGQIVTLDSGAFVLKAVILLYACEVMIAESRSSWGALRIGVLGSAAVLALRGLI